MSALSAAIFCRTYHKDAQRLEFTLRSVERYCSDFLETVVATPASSVDVIAPVVQRFSFARLVEVPTVADDYLGQQLTKLTAHRFTDADMIVHLDSDCVFYRPTTPNDLAPNGLPILYSTPYAYFARQGFYVPWQSITSAILRKPVELEFMRQFPLSYPRQLYLDLNAWYEREHGWAIENILNEIEGDHFSEFNLMGAFSYYQPGDYNEHVVIRTEATDSRVRQFCGGQRYNRSIGPEDQAELERLVPTGIDSTAGQDQPSGEPHPEQLGLAGTGSAL